MRITLYVHCNKEAAYEVGRAAGLNGKALDLFVFAGYEHAVEYEVNQQTGESTPVKFDGKDLAP